MALCDRRGPGGGRELFFRAFFLFGAGQCLVYERTGSLFAVVAIHAGFNTFAMLSVVPLPAILIGLLVILGRLLAPRMAGRWPSPEAA